MDRVSATEIVESPFVHNQENKHQTVHTICQRRATSVFAVLQFGLNDMAASNSGMYASAMQGIANKGGTTNINHPSHPHATHGRDTQPQHEKHGLFKAAQLQKIRPAATTNENTPPTRETHLGKGNDPAPKTTCS
jgi:hypothetical protein